MNLALFDFDGTITNKDSLGRIFIFLNVLIGVKLLTKNISNRSYFY